MGAMLGMALAGNLLPTQPDPDQFVSYVGVALIAKGQLLGVLELFQRSRLEPDSDWLSFLEALAGQMARLSGKPRPSLPR